MLQFGNITASVHLKGINYDCRDFSKKHVEQAAAAIALRCLGIDDGRRADAPPEAPPMKKLCTENSSSDAAHTKNGTSESSDKQTHSHSQPEVINKSLEES